MTCSSLYCGTTYSNTLGLMVWDATAYGSMSSSVFISDNMTSQRYVNDIVEPYFHPNVRTDLGLTFQQVNDRPHIAMNTLNCLEISHVNLLP